MVLVYFCSLLTELERFWGGCGAGGFASLPHVKHVWNGGYSFTERASREVLKS